MSDILNKQTQQTNGTEANVFYSYYPATGQYGDQPFTPDTPQQISEKVEAAAAAFQVYRLKSGMQRAAFLNTIADELEALGEALVEICSKETALPPARIQGERARTAGQLRLFAAMLQEGSWVQARIDTAMPERTPLPRPDLRQMQRPLGPVAVFGASNFPLAFSVLGGDTASALAAGCTVVFKAHPAHPATSAMVAEAVAKAIEKEGMPASVFSLVTGDGPSVGQQLVQHPAIKAVGFTGSYRAGKAIFDTVNQRPEPIPVYAEMGSLNPVFILPGAMQEKSQAIAEGFTGSLTMGVGQFCTNPGLVIYTRQDSDELLDKLRQAVQDAQGGSMLTAAICSTYNRQVQELKEAGKVAIVAEGKAPASDNAAQPIVFKTTVPGFIENNTLHEEMFGPASILIEGSGREEVLAFARSMQGHLTATVHATPEDLDAYGDLLQVLEQKVGRVLINGYPTGVEVSHAMVHGGPFPATTDSRSTSVGTMAIYRFTRPVCYQNYPQQLLADELKDDNPLNIQRLVNGNYSR